MENSSLVFIGQLIFGGYFVLMGLMHFMKTNMLAEMAKRKKVPAAKASVLVAGLLLLYGGFGIIFAAYIEWAVLALILFLVPSAFLMHNFWAIQESQDKMAQMMNFLRNMAFVGAALIALLLV
jgi:uncharacterized membrane protein YphA (DoxX/SURF4 family)